MCSSLNLMNQKFSKSAVILAAEVSKRCILDLPVAKAQDGWIFDFPTIRPFLKKIFKDQFVTSRVEFGVAFSNTFLSFSAFLGFLKALEQDAMFSSVSAVCRRKVPHILISYLTFLFRVHISNVYKSTIVLNSIETRFSRSHAARLLKKLNKLSKRKMVLEVIGTDISLNHVRNTF